MQENEKQECLIARQCFDARLAEDSAPIDLGGRTKEAVELHLKECPDCLVWQRETTALVAAASQLPQYDVPEALTQRILTQVAVERARPDWFRIATLCAVAAACLAVLVMKDAFESVDGLLSWMLSGVTMFILAWFMRDKSEVNVTDVSEVA